MGGTYQRRGQGDQMTDNREGMNAVPDRDLSSVRGGRSFWGSVKAAGRWIKDHVVLGLKAIGIKGKF
jgi:hypothetical protein